MRNETLNELSSTLRGEWITLSLTFKWVRGYSATPARTQSEWDSFLQERAGFAGRTPETILEFAQNVEITDFAIDYESECESSI